jgi:hypothetical protein
MHINCDARGLVLKLTKELNAVAGRGASLDYLAVQLTFQELADAYEGSTDDQGDVIHGFIMRNIELREKPWQFKGRNIPAARVRPAWIMNLGMNEPYLAASERCVRTMQILGLSYKASTWRRKEYQGRLLEPLAWDIVNRL